MHAFWEKVRVGHSGELPYDVLSCPLSPGSLLRVAVVTHRGKGTD